MRPVPARHSAARVGRAALAFAAGALLLGGCGGGEGVPGEAGFAQARRIDLNTYSCADWKRADPATRRHVVERLRDFAGGQVSGDRGVGGRGVVLDDDHAYSLFEERCEPPHARGFLLYKLYTFAAAFAGQAP